MKNNIKMVFFDIDDTLVVKDTQYMPESVPAAIAKLHQNDVAVGIATGRARFGVVPMVQALEPDYYVTINGQYVIDKDNNSIYSNPLAKEDIERFVSWCNEHGVEYGFVGSETCVVSKWTPLVQDAIEIIYGKLAEDPNFYQTNTVYQMWTFTDKQNEAELPSELLEKVKVVRWHEHSCDLFPINGSKANGIQAVLDKLNISREQVMAFGDGLNDVEMFGHVGVAVAMGNAHPDLLQHADYVTKNIDDDGVEYALKHFGLI